MLCIAVPIWQQWASKAAYKVNSEWSEQSLNTLLMYLDITGLLNRFQTVPTSRLLWRWCFSDTLVWTETQIVSRIVESWPVTRLDGGLSWWLQSTDDNDAMAWLINDAYSFPWPAEVSDVKHKFLIIAAEICITAFSTMPQKSACTCQFGSDYQCAKLTNEARLTLFIAH